MKLTSKPSLCGGHISTFYKLFGKGDENQKQSSRRHKREQEKQQLERFSGRFADDTQATTPVLRTSREGRMAQVRSMHEGKQYYFSKIFGF